MKYGAVVQYWQSNKHYHPDFYTLCQRAGMSYISGTPGIQYADNARAHGLKIVMCYSSIVGKEAYISGIWASKTAIQNHLAQYNISQYNGHSGVYGHVLTIEPMNDEDSLSTVNPSSKVLNFIEVMKAGVAYIKSQDPSHPVWVGLNAAGAYDEGGDFLDRRRAWIRRFIDWCDVLDWHLYRFEIGGHTFKDNIDALDVRTEEMLTMLKEESKGKPIVIGEVGVPTGTFGIWGNPSVTLTEQDQLTYFQHVAPKFVKYGVTPFIFKLQDDFPLYEGAEAIFGVYKGDSSPKTIVDYLPSLFSGGNVPEPTPEPAPEPEPEPEPTPEPTPQDSNALAIAVFTAALAALKGEK